MTNTLIVRDATLAINGVSVSAQDPDSHIRERIEEASRMDRATVVDCAEVLRSSSGVSGGDPDVLEALVVIALAHPDVAKPLDLSAQVLGRRLSARLERNGEAERALAVLRILLEVFPRNEAIEREISALMRRQGMVQDLAERYEARAEELLSAGKTDEAIAWLREILLLDRSRSDIARCIRDLRLRTESKQHVRKTRSRLILISLLVSAASVGVVRREIDVREAFQGLPKVQGETLESREERLVGLERFLRRYPVWHGAIDVLRERNGLRIEVMHMRHQAENESFVIEEPVVTANEQAEITRMKAISEAHKGDRQAMVRSLELFTKALELADETWADGAQTERDIASIREHLQEESKP